MVVDADGATEPWLDADQLGAWIVVLALFETLPGAIDNQLKRDAGMNRFEYSVLAMLSAEPTGSLAMSDLADVAFGSLSRLSHAVGRLERRGWVDRCAADDGRKQTLVRLTDEGRRAIEDAAPGHAREVRRLLVDAITDDELRQLAAIARKIMEVAEPDRSTAIDDAIDRVIAATD